MRPAEAMPSTSGFAVSLEKVRAKFQLEKQQQPHPGWMCYSVFIFLFSLQKRKTSLTLSGIEVGILCSQATDQITGPPTPLHWK